MRLLFLVTGPRASGKTSYCVRVAELLSRDGGRSVPAPCAIIEESRRDAEGIPLELRLRDPGKGDSVALAARKSREAFVFDEAAFAWAAERLEEAAARGQPLILDEIGPLEIVEHRGFSSLLNRLLRDAAGPLILSVRPSLLETLRTRIEQTAPGEWDIAVIGTEDPAQAASAAQSAADRIICHCQERRAAL